LIIKNNDQRKVKTVYYILLLLVGRVKCQGMNGEAYCIVLPILFLSEGAGTGDILSILHNIVTQEQVNGILNVENTNKISPNIN
jgi:hypothetical protein